MANPLRDPLRRMLALGMATLVVVLSATSSILDGSQRFQGVAFESEHKAGVCQAHDHSLCTQIATRHVLAAATPSHHELHQTRWEPQPPSSDAVPPRPFRALEQSRAPPLL